MRVILRELFVYDQSAAGKFSDVFFRVVLRGAIMLTERKTKIHFSPIRSIVNGEA